MRAPNVSFVPHVVIQKALKDRVLQKYLLHFGLIRGTIRVGETVVFTGR